jgi:hypothetical protein
VVTQAALAPREAVVGGVSHRHHDLITEPGACSRACTLLVMRAPGRPEISARDLGFIFGSPLLVALYAWALHWVYSELVTTQFAYLGYRYTDPSPDGQIIAWLIATAVIFTLPRRLDRPSAVMLWVLFSVTVAPSILMAPYTSYLAPIEALTMSLVVGATFGVVALAQRGERRALGWNVSPTSLWIVLALFSCVTYLLLMVTQGLSFQFLAILDVYDVRAEYVDETSSVGILAYLVVTQANIVNPMIAARGFVHRKWGLVAVAVIGQLILYSTTGFKHVLFAILAWLVIIIVLRRKGTQTRGDRLLLGATALVLIAALVDSLANSNVATSLFSRRFIFTPGVFTSIYVRFFSENPQAHLGHSVLRYFVDYPYELNPPYIIGQWMANNPSLAANANLFADGYSNFGYLGVIGAGIVLLVYMRFLDRAAVGLPIVMSGMVVVIPAVTLSNTSVLTGMLSHGLVAAVLLLALVPRDTLSEQELRDAKQRKRELRRF